MPTFIQYYIVCLSTLRKNGAKTAHLGCYLAVRNLAPLGVLLCYPTDRGVLLRKKITPLKKGAIGIQLGIPIPMGMNLGECSQILVKKYLNQKKISV